MTTVAAINSMGHYAFNPRGNLWYDDESTFGHKLLSKMGWSKGKGLGKNEDGIKENIKIKVKGNNSGVGWKGKLYADVQSIEYDALLESLNGGNSQNGKTSKPNNKKNRNRSLVELSRGFRNRLHYQKFIKGKDVSQYSEQDMKAIFLFNSKSDDKKSENHTEKEQVETASEDKGLNPVETYKSELSISDYFAKKMKERNDKLLNKISSNKPEQQQTVSEVENVEKSVSSSTSDANGKVNGNGSTKKKRKNPEEIISMNNSNSVIAEEKVQSFSECTVPKKKRKKSFEESVIEDASLHESCENEISYEILNKKKKKKKKRSKIGKDHLSSITIDQVCNGNANSYETQELTKNSETKSNISPSDSVVITDVHSTTSDITKQLKKEKKKKMKKFKMKTLKSCLKSKKGKYCVKNVSFSESVSYRIINKDNSIFDFNSDSHLVFPDKKESNILDAQNDCGSGAEEAPIDETNTDVPDAMSEVQMHVEESGDSALPDLSYTKPPHFNMWVESQNQALKMKIYKNMLKSIKKHDVLQTTNLLSIKGYGNWGF